jgi:FKBP12-rapamycin complex-associated protein
MYYSVIWNTEDRLSSVEISTDLSSQEESWLAKLGAWSEALGVYENKLLRDPNDFEAIVGCMRCHIANGEWRRVLELAENNWLHDRDNENAESMNKKNEEAVKAKRKAKRMCAQAAWRLGQWGDLEKYASQLANGGNHLPSSSAQSPGMNDSPRINLDFDGAFYSAVLHIHRNDWSNAAEAIDAARKAMDSRLTALMAESYSRAYSSMVTAQTLAEMEEIVELRKIEGLARAGEFRHPLNRPNDTDARKNLLSVWRKRLAGCRVDAEVHASILAVRSLILGPTDEVDSTLRLSDLSRQSQRPKFAERILLDPLEALNANLKGPCFGFGVSEQLRLRVDFSSLTGSAFSAVIDRILQGEMSQIIPYYGQKHEQWSRSLVNEAGGLDRYAIEQ